MIDFVKIDRAPLKDTKNEEVGELCFEDIHNDS